MIQKETDNLNTPITSEEAEAELLKKTNHKEKPR